MSWGRLTSLLQVVVFTKHGKKKDIQLPHHLRLPYARAREDHTLCSTHYDACKFEIVSAVPLEF